MAVMVDLDKVKEIIGNKDASVISVDAYRSLMNELDRLAYGKIYTCWCCGDKIYGGEHGWYHVDTRLMECNKWGNDWVKEFRATPKPKEMED